MPRLCLAVLLGVLGALSTPAHAAAPSTTTSSVTRTSTSPATIPIRFDQAFVRAEGDALSVSSRAVEPPLLSKWWFWGVVGVVMTGVVVSGLVLSSGGNFVPEGELGNSRTSEWNRF